MERDNGREETTKGKSTSPIKVPSHLRCLICKTHHYIILPPNITKDRFIQDLGDFISGKKYIQDAFSYLSADDRELLLTGYCSKAWDQLFGEEDE